MVLSPILAALLGTGFTFLATVIGAALVYFIKDTNKSLERIFLGFAAGVMIAASVWSLLIPALEMAKEQGQGWFSTVGGFVIGIVFLLVLDNLLPHFHPGAKVQEGLPSSLKRTTLLVLAVTLHNIPEGLAVGLAFGLAASGDQTITMASAIVLAIGMALQNLPEGAAISLPLKQEGLSKNKAFLYGALSGAVEPIAGVMGVILAGSIVGMMPWFLSFAAGAMMYVVVEELIPEAQMNEHSHSGTLGVLSGFLLMMILDVSLG